ncbi:MAG TPA: aldo/keto reductase family protein [Chloroflexota bacterium]|nr:aldo/keto reductase family protein [Chloroflexota bacterium]
MEYRRLGRAGVQVSTIALGSWLTYGGAVPDETARDVVKTAYDLGINFFDTANGYSAGRAEEFLGHALRDYPRDTYVLATKVYFPTRPGPNGGGLSRKHIMDQAHKSLRRLGVEYVDLYQAHRYDPHTPLDETLRAFDDLIRDGKVLYAGVSEWSAAQLTDAVATARERNFDQIVSNQPVYNMLERYIESEVIPVCEHDGIGQVVFSPLAQGVLTGKYQPGRPPPAGSRATDRNQNMFMGDLLQDRVLDAVARLGDVARESGCTLAQMALAWVLRQRNVSAAIIGASRPEQVRENAGAAGIQLTPATLSEIDRILAPLTGEG